MRRLGSWSSIRVPVLAVLLFGVGAWGLGGCTKKETGGKKGGGGTARTSRESAGASRSGTPGPRGARTGAQAVFGYGDFKVKLASGQAIRFSRKAPGRWEAKQAATTWAAEKGSDGTILLKKDGTLVGQATPKGAKLNFFDTDKHPYFGFVFKETKIKVFLPGSSVPWKFSYKTEKVKVKLGDDRKGKVKFYPDDKKLKAKDADGRKVAQINGVNRLSGVLAPFVVDGLDQDKKVFMALVLLVLGK